MQVNRLSELETCDFRRCHPFDRGSSGVEAWRFAVKSGLFKRM